MGIKVLISHQAIADTPIKSGDPHRDDCGCGLSYEHDDAQELQELIYITLDVIEVFGEAGLRALSNRAEMRADELDIKVRAKLAKAEAEKALGEARLSEYDQLALAALEVTWTHTTSRRRWRAARSIQSLKLCVSQACS